jgi:hypothetical protein
MRWFSDAGQTQTPSAHCGDRRASPSSPPHAALGIGATTAIYSVVDTILLQPLPFVDGDRPVRVVRTCRRWRDVRRKRGVSYQSSSNGANAAARWLMRSPSAPAKRW